VLQVALSLAPGGTERLIVELSRRLHDPYGMAVCCLDDPGVWAEELRSAGVPVTALGRPPGFYPKLGARIAAVARQQDATILHCHHYSPFVYGMLARLWAPLHVIFTEHGRLDGQRASTKRRLANAVLSRMPARVFSVSENLRGHLVHEGFNSKQVKVVYNGIELEPARADIARQKARDRLGIDPSTFLIGAVGRLDPVKSLETLIEAFASVQMTLPRSHLLIVGDGPSRSSLEDRAQRAGVAGAVTFAGHREDVRRILPGFDVYVNSSVFEGVSLTILEAMAAELPIVATSVGGTPEVVVHNQTGVLVPAGNSGAIAEAIRAFHFDPERRTQLAAAARKRVEEHFSIERMVATYRAIYESLGSLS
jgi:glycosyltransferase involved in cell wall biosynthesis